MHIVLCVEYLMGQKVSAKIIRQKGIYIGFESGGDHQSETWKNMDKISTPMMHDSDWYEYFFN